MECANIVPNSGGSGEMDVNADLSLRCKCPDSSVGKTVCLMTSYISLQHGFELCWRNASKYIEW